MLFWGRWPTGFEMLTTVDPKRMHVGFFSYLLNRMYVGAEPLKAI